MMQADEARKYLETLKTNEEFVSEVRYDYGEPDEWDLDDTCFQDLAAVFYAWNTDPEVLEARKIIASGFDFEMRKPYGVEAFHVFNGIMSEMPNWPKYYDENVLKKVARAVISSYESADIANKYEFE